MITNHQPTNLPIIIEKLIYKNNMYSYINNIIATSLLRYTPYDHPRQMFHLRQSSRRQIPILFSRSA